MILALNSDDRIPCFIWETRGHRLWAKANDFVLIYEQLRATCSLPELVWLRIVVPPWAWAVHIKGLRCAIRWHCICGLFPRECGEHVVWASPFLSMQAINRPTGIVKVRIMGELWVKGWKAQIRVYIDQVRGICEMINDLSLRQRANEKFPVKCALFLSTLTFSQIDNDRN